MALALQVLHDRGRILRRQVGEEPATFACAVDAQDDEGEDADQGSGHRRHGSEARSAQRPDELDESLHDRAPALDHGTRSAPDPASFAGLMVSIWLTDAAGGKGVARAAAGEHQIRQRRLTSAGADR